MPVHPICYSSPLRLAWLTAFVHTNPPPPSPPTLTPLMSSSFFPASAPKHACLYFYFSWQCSPPAALSVCQGKAQYCGIEAEETPPCKSQPDGFFQIQISYFSPCSSLFFFSVFVLCSSHLSSRRELGFSVNMFSKSVKTVSSFI